MEDKEAFIKDFIYNDTQEEKIQKIEIIDDPDTLHIIAANYNWNDGFEIPYLILNNKSCDLGTALMIFYLAEGELFLLEAHNTSKNKEWISFLNNLYDRINENLFINKSIKYIPVLSKIQAYKIKKINTNYRDIFFEGTTGIELNTRL
ncbi:DUF4274 domain-containing protein [Paenibacillus solanacearum]|nr:DUF4274 domain-containing protein [Paenibacillus solanacearum]